MYIIYNIQSHCTATMIIICPPPKKKSTLSRVMVFNATFNNISVISWRSTLSEHFQNLIEKSQKETNSINLSHRCMTAQCPGYVQPLQ